jgi:hypothetical protein
MDRIPLHTSEVCARKSLKGFSMVLSVFSAPARYMVVKITRSCSEMVLRTMKNYKAHYSLSWFRPLL